MTVAAKAGDDLLKRREDIESQWLNLDKKILSIKEMLTKGKSEVVFKQKTFNALLESIINSRETRMNLEGLKNKEIADVINLGLGQFWLKRWEDVVGEAKAKEVMSLIDWVYAFDWKLLPPAEGLEKMAKSAIFWQDVTGLNIIKTYEGDFSIFNVHEAQKKNLFYNLIDTNPDSQKKRKIDYKFYSDFDYKIIDILNAYIDDSMLRFRAIPAYQAFDHLRNVVHYLVVFCILNRTDLNLLPLRDIYKNGNYPIGFDKDNRLIVLCGKAE